MASYPSFLTMLAYLPGGQDQETTTTCLNLDTHEDLLSLLQSNVSHGPFERPLMNNHLARSTNTATISNMRIVRMSRVIGVFSHMTSLRIEFPSRTEREGVTARSLVRSRPTVKSILDRSPHLKTDPFLRLLDRGREESLSAESNSIRINS
jgi:hypothetical protein